MRLFLISLAVAALVSGCGDSHSGHGHGAGTDQDHEPKTAQISVWTNGYEIFAEHQAPVVNEPVQFVTHVTDLQTFAPRREGAATFIMRQGDQQLEHTEAKPARDGIYLPKLTFPKSGQWELVLTIPSGQANAVIALGRIEVHKDAHDAAHAEFPEPPDGVSFLKEQQWKLPTTTSLAGTRSLTERIRVPGRTRTKPGFSAEIVSPVPGQVVSRTNGMMPGDRVEAGQVLAEIQPRFTEATARLAEVEGEYIRTRAELTTADAMLARAKKLRAEGIASEAEFEEAEVAFKRAQGNLEAAKALRALYQDQPANLSRTSSVPLIEIRATIAGVLNRAPVGLGEAVSEGQTLFSIVNPEALWIEAYVPETLAASLGGVNTAAYERLSKPGELIEGARRVFTGLAIDPETRSVPTIYEIAAGPRVGEAVTLYLETQRVENGIVLPESAIVEEAGQPITFVQVAGETFAKRPVKLGIHDGQYVEVREGLTPGERVVTNGAFAIRLAAASGGIPAHGHAH